MSTLFPRLPDSVAAVLYAQRSALPLSDLSGLPHLHHSAQIYAATGGRRVEESELLDIRTKIVETATEFGYPAPCLEPVRFDRRLAPLLHASMRIVPAEAANRHVWSFIALVLAPDVTCWRFGGGNAERWIASDLTRHMFARLWWQAHLLVDYSGGTADTALLDALSESDLNQLLERTTIGGTRTLVRSLARSVLEYDSTLARRELIRESALRIRRRMAFVDHLALDPDVLRRETDLVVRQAAEALAAEGDLEPVLDVAHGHDGSGGSGVLEAKFGPRTRTPVERD